ncbi:MAG: hypothetical protein ABIN48_08860 [Ginsengibacter sp.]
MQDLFIFMFAVVVLVLFYIHISKLYTIEDIIDQNLQARGGVQKINSIETIQMDGVKKMPGLDLLLRLTKVKGRLFHALYRAGNQYNGVIVTPEKGWKFSSGEYDLVPMHISQWSDLKMEMDIFGPLIHHKEKGYKLFYEGKEWVNEILCYRVRLKSNDGNAGFYFIDTKTHLLLQSRTQSATLEGSLSGSYEIVHQFLEYQEFDGVLFPTIIVNESIRESFTLYFQNIELNVKVNEHLFGPES